MIEKITSGILILFSSVALVTKFEYFEINQTKESLNRQSFSNHKDVNVHLRFHEVKKKKKIIVPVLYNNFQYIGPYIVHLGISGPIEEIELIDTVLLMNGKKVDFNFYDGKWEEYYYEGGTKRIYKNIDGLDINWKNLKTLIFTIEFKVIQDGKEVKYKKELEFEPILRKYHANYLLDNLTV